MNIVKLEENDLKEALILIRNVFDEFIGIDFPNKGRIEFYEFISLNNMLAKFNEKTMSFWGSYIDNKLVGVLALKENKHISLLFVDKNYQGRGIATGLFEVIKELCEKNPAIDKISVNSSMCAFSFYKKIGFVEIDKEIEKNGIRYTPMNYKLN